MQYFFTSVLLALTTATSACDIPTDTLSNTISYGFGILIQNPAFPVIHDRYMNLDPAGGGDNHLFLAPVGNPTFNLVLEDGILEQDIIHAVIDGEYSAVDNTTKMFMTERGDPKAIFQPVYGCDPDDDSLQIQLAFQTREDSPYGGSICVRVASGNRGYEFRYSPPDNPAFDPTNPCMPVTMVVIAGSAASSTAIGTSSPTTVATSASISTPTTTTTSSAQSTPTGPLINGIWSYYGCYTEATNMRALSQATFAEDTMTLEACATYCQNYVYWGTEYARECYCGNSFNQGSVPAPQTDCSFPCMGDAAETCGAGLRLSVYTKNPVVVSSSSSSSSSSLSTFSTSTTSSSQGSSPSSSSSTSSSSTSSSSTSISSTSSSSTSSSSSSSSSSTSTTSTTSSSQTSTTTSSSTSSSSTSSTSTTSSSTPTGSPLPYTDMTSLGFSYLGCAPEERRAPNTPPGRVLAGTLYADDAMTNEKCVAFCSSNGYVFAGTEYTRECWCANSVAPGRMPLNTVASLAGCNFLCGGAPAEECGGDAWLSLYQACPAGGPCINAAFT